MKITLKDGSVREYSEAMTVNDIAFDIAGGLGRAACAGEVDGEVVDLRTTIDKDCTLNILTFKDEAGKAAYRHTASHVLAEAVKKVFDLTPRGIERALELRSGKFKYQDLAAFGHIGRTDLDIPWEKLDKVEELKKALNK